MSGPPRRGDGGAALVGSLIALALVVLWPAAVQAQGLGDAAGRERERREKKPAAPAQVFTDHDLTEEHDADADAAAGVDAAEAAEPAEGEEEGPPELSKVGAADPLRAELDREREERELAEREWRARFAEARARVREAEARCWREVVRTEFRQGIPVQMKVQEFVESEELRQAKREVAELEEEFRRTGLPPGWARE